MSAASTPSSLNTFLRLLAVQMVCDLQCRGNDSKVMGLIQVEAGGPSPFCWVPLFLTLPLSQGISLLYSLHDPIMYRSVVEQDTPS